jgi:sulfur-oxidizing protein SoxY
MERRQFLSLAFSAVAVAALPMNLRAEDYRKLKPTMWEAHTVEDSLKAMYGKTETVAEGIKLKSANVAFDSGKKAVASNGGAIPVAFSTKIPAKTVAVFQDANPEAAVCVYHVGPKDITDYEIKIKMAKSGYVMVVVEGQDGKLYSARQDLDVALGGCEG